MCFLTDFPEDEVFETAPENAAIVVGDDHVIQCAPRDPTLLIMWEKDGELLQYTEAIHKVPQSVNLLIRDAWMTDSGRYTCVAKTFDGNIVSTASAELNVFPRQDVKEGEGNTTTSLHLFIVSEYKEPSKRSHINSTESFTWAKVANYRGCSSTRSSTETN